MINRAPAISYDEVPYRSRSLPLTHPNHVGTLATMFGMHPAPVTQCRVLELGCAGGRNLIPMAYTLPESSFVGIDLSERQIADGQQIVDALGLHNIVLTQANLLDLGADLGQFDYIIGYGVYSWVPRGVRDRLLAICQRHLAPQGVAFISYNTYPGWHIRGMIRDMMMYHSQSFTTTEQRLSQARAVLDFLVEATAQLGANQPRLKLYSQILEQERDQIREQPDFYLAHEHLSEENQPIYFTQFVEHAAEYQLQYIADAQLSTMLTGLLPAEIGATLEAITPDSIAVEQFMDFLSNRTFRQSLLCHDDVVLKRELDPQDMYTLQVASSARAVTPDQSEFSATVEKFRIPSGSVVSAKSALTSAALHQLAEIWPQALPFDQLLANAQARAAGADPAVGDSVLDSNAAERLGDMILTCYSMDVVELRMHTPHFVLTAGERPVASRFARLQAQHDSVVSNLCHNSVALDPACLTLMPYLDGEHDRDALLEILGHEIDTGALVMESGEESFSNAHQRGEALATLLEHSLNKLAHNALLLE